MSYKWAFFLYGLSLSAEKIDLLLEWHSNPVHVALYAGQEKGFFKQENIELNLLKTLDETYGIQFLEINRCDIALTYTLSFMRALERADQFQIIATYVNEGLQGVAVLEESEIKTPMDLKEKTIAAKPNGTTAKILNHFASHQNIAYKTIKKMTMNEQLALIFGKVDAISGIFWNIEGHKLAASHVKTRIFPFTTLGVPPYPELLFISKKNHTKKNQDLVQRFKRALEASIFFAKSNPDEAFLCYQKCMVDKGKKTLNWEKQSWKETWPLLSLDGKVDHKRLQTLHIWMKENNLLQYDYDPNLFF
ncbi:MAG: ABC transporter substrate-binding protein [Simkaniaceae bacterium]